MRANATTSRSVLSSGSSAAAAAAAECAGSLPARPFVSTARTCGFGLPVACACMISARASSSCRSAGTRGRVLCRRCLLTSNSRGYRRPSPMPLSANHRPRPKDFVITDRGRVGCPALRPVRHAVSVFKMVFKMEAWIPCDFYSMQNRVHGRVQ